MSAVPLPAMAGKRDRRYAGSGVGASPLLIADRLIQARERVPFRAVETTRDLEAPPEWIAGKSSFECDAAKRLDPGPNRPVDPKRY